MERAKAGDWVEIEEILLQPGERAPQVPEDTQKTPLRQWMKGYMVTEEGCLGDIVEVTTLIGRKVAGKLSSINPRHVHDYGNPVKELIDVGIELREEIENL